MSSQKTNQGFTIIEVVLVLAIAGLIFLIVFLALPALQKAQRDTQRKNDLSRFLSQLSTYSGNNQGNVPSDWTTTGSFYTQYLTANGETFNDPQGNAYSLTTQANNATPPTTTIGSITVYTNNTTGAKCDSTRASGINNGAGARSVAVTMPLEKGGYLCQNN